MWTPDFDGTNRHAGRKFNANLGAGRKYYAGPDPFVAFQWKIEISGVTLAHFQEVSGLTVQTEVVKFREGGQNDYEHMLMGQTTYTNIVLKHGVTANKALFDWKDSTTKFGRGGARRDGSIVLLDGKTAELARWNFTRGWPCKWDGPTFTGQSAIAIERVEIAHEGLTRAQ